VSAQSLTPVLAVALVATGCGSKAKTATEGDYGSVRAAYEAFHDARQGYIYGRVGPDELVDVTDRARDAAARFHDRTKSRACARFVAGYFTEIATFSAALHTGSFDDEPAASADAFGERMEEQCD
jgi:hypothetical protein